MNLRCTVISTVSLAVVGMTKLSAGSELILTRQAKAAVSLTLSSGLMERVEEKEDWFADWVVPEMGVPYTVTSSHSVVVCGILLQITQCDRVGGVSIYNVCYTIDSVTLCRVCVSLLTTVEYVVGLSSVCYTEDSDPDSGIGGVDIVDSSSGNIGD